MIIQSPNRSTNQREQAHTIKPKRLGPNYDRLPFINLKLEEDKTQRFTFVRASCKSDHFIR